MSSIRRGVRLSIEFRNWFIGRGSLVVLELEIRLAMELLGRERGKDRILVI